MFLRVVQWLALGPVTCPVHSREPISDYKDIRRDRARMDVLQIFGLLIESAVKTLNVDQY